MKSTEIALYNPNNDLPLFRLGWEKRQTVAS